MMKKICILISCLLLVGCATRPKPAPIENMTNIPNYVQPVDKPTTIAAPPKLVAPTRMTALNNPQSESSNPVTKVAKKAASAPATVVAPALVVDTATVVGGGEWLMPTVGKTEGFSKSNKGIDIYGTEGQVINAINDGKVVYSGNGLKGYGNLIIIKHANMYLSAYAHNKINLVKEGANVKRGQEIAEMGVDDSARAVLHLEVRKNGKPMDPLSIIKQ